MGGKSSFSGNAKGSGKFKTFAKKGKPLIFLLGVFVVAFVGATAVQSLFPFGFMSRTEEDWNSTKTSSTKRTDTTVDDQLAGGDSSDDPNKTIYDNMGFSDQQIESFKMAGLDYEQSDDGKTVALSYTAGDKKYVVANNNSLSSRMSNNKIAESDGAVSDASSGGMSEEEAKQQILADLNESPDTIVMTFSQAMNDSNFKQKYTAGTSFYRGDSSGWYSQTTDMVMKRLDISRNNFKDYTDSHDNNKNTEWVVEYAKSHNAANPEGTSDDSASIENNSKSLMERVKTVANKFWI